MVLSDLYTKGSGTKRQLLSENKNKGDLTQKSLKTANTTDSLRFAPISQADKFYTLDTVKAIRSS